MPAFHPTYEVLPSRAFVLNTLLLLYNIDTDSVSGVSTETTFKYSGFKLIMLLLL